jgi:hypothetical protein
LPTSCSPLAQRASLAHLAHGALLLVEAGDATRMSGSDPQRAPVAAPARSFPRMAQTWLCVFFALMSPACLVTSTTDFADPEQTPPFLVASRADPDIREFLVVVDGESRKDFTAQVLSEDRGESVKIALYIDYGRSNVAGQPFRNAITNFPDIPAGTLRDGPRQVRAQWFPDIHPVENGCHTITMMVTHEFDFQDCPETLSDSSQLVWKVLRCESREKCDPIVLDNPMLACPSAEQAPLPACSATSLGPDAGDGGGP